MIQIKDVIHHYINSEALYRVTYVDSCGFTVWSKLRQKRYRQLDDKSIEAVEYALRRLEDMTEDERTEYHKFTRYQTDGVHAVLVKFDTPESFHYLLKQGFDLWNLIENNLAIDQKTLNQKV